MATTADFKNGLVLKIDNKLQQIVEFQHVKPGKGPAFVRTKLKDVVTGKVTDKTFNAGVKVETATVDRRDMTYLYHDGSSYVVMDEKTYEQLELAEHIFGNSAKFLLENTTVQVSFHEGGSYGVAHRTRAPGRPLQRRHETRHLRDRRRDSGPLVHRDR